MKNFVAAHPEFAAFGAWAGSAPWTGSYAEDPYNSLNGFLFTDAAGAEHAVRWSLVPAGNAGRRSPEELAKRGPDYLEEEIAAAGRRGAAALDPGGDGRQSRRSDGGPEQGLAGGPAHRRGRHAGGAEDRGRGRRPVPRHQLRSDHPARRHRRVGRSVPGGPLVGLREVLRPARRPRRRTIRAPPTEPSHDPAVARFTALQRLLHWVMAVCILAMLFIGVGMVSTVMPKYLPLVATHKTLGIAIWCWR